MKHKIKLIALAGLLLFSWPAVKSQIEENFTGKWKFEAPNAPEGSTQGNIEIKTNAVIMTFDDLTQFPSSWVKVRNDSIIYETAFDLAKVQFSLKVIDKNNMAGKAVWEGGETPVILKKEVEGVKL
jgi:hypothetical protein